MDYDTFWTSSHRGWFVHGRHNRTLRREELDIQRPDGKYVAHKAKSLDGCKRAIDRIIKRETA
jgi:hypothetical protein